ncbi:flagellar basal body L-ring protein FlgH [Sansalvadorimonas sp. 2012CJ34-2]|uniref:Flagellar L-ring protein n=2 Tax=Parendozoicomonas callyspongiae TaxID=2942213 RepID=A0ABT0PFK3_9GAMM|nr:flagellar basal body L-ring protein FlgH [Sansalvadorimonas sp. 2012CJ34-2]
MSGCSLLPKPDAQPDTKRWAPIQPPLVKTQTTNNGSLYNPTYANNLFEDRMAFRVGDILTVRLDESTSSKKSSGTDFNKNSSVGMKAPTLFGSLKDWATSIGTDRTFEGKANSSQNNQLQGDITVTVAEVYPNGSLRIVGEKWLRLNQGDEYIRLEGILRPEDISPNNVVLSKRLANARIMYSGAGPLNDANDPGWLNRFFNSPIYPM